MLDLLFVGLMQAAMGDPQQPAAAGSPPAAESPAPAPATTEQPQEEQSQERQVRCRTQAYAGSRLGQRRCSSRSDDDRNARDARQQLEQFQRPSPLSGS